MLELKRARKNNKIKNNKINKNNKRPWKSECVIIKKSILDW